jgi:hypothetical protein
MVVRTVGAQLELGPISFPLKEEFPGDQKFSYWAGLFRGPGVSSTSPPPPEAAGREEADLLDTLHHY